MVKFKTACCFIISTEMGDYRLAILNYRSTCSLTTAIDAACNFCQSILLAIPSQNLNIPGLVDDVTITV